MKFSRLLDVMIAAAIVVSTSLIAAAAGYARLIEYFLIVSSVFFAVCASLRAKPLFLSGSCLTLCITNFPYSAYAISTSDINSSGFVVMSQVTSTVGGLAGAIIASALLRRYAYAGATMALFVGFAGVSVGWFTTQLTICNTVMWCGPLTFSFK